MVEFVDLADLLHQGRAAGHLVAMRDSERVDFAAFERDVAQWHGAFAAHGGNRFALYFQDSYVFASALFGAWHAKKTVYLLADVLPANLASLQSVVDGFAGDFPGVACVSPLSVQEPPTWYPLDRQARSLVVYTSGSSGAPVAIPKRLSQLFDEVHALAQRFSDRFGDASVCATVSHQHIYGLLFAVLLPLACGRPLLARRLAYAEDIAGELAKEGGHVLVASPAHLKRLPEQLSWGTTRANLRAVFSSGGPLPADALPLCLQVLGQTPIEIYGSSETGGVAWRQRQVAGEGVWQALPGVAMKIDDGALHIRSKHTDSEGWQALSDRVRAVGNGFELLGRADRILKIEEKRVSLNAVELALVNTGLIAEVRVLVETGQRTQLIVVAVPSADGWQVLDTEGKQSLNARLRAELERVIEATTLPRRWRYVYALPVNAQGKTTERALLALFDPRRPTTRLLARSANAVSLQVEISPRSPFFDGHFAQAPILPGVAQLDWVVLFGREFFPLPPRFLRLEAVKFQQVIQPGMSIEMTLNFEADRGRLGFTLRSAAGSHASGRIVFGPAA